MAEEFDQGQRWIGQCPLDDQKDRFLNKPEKARQLDIIEGQPKEGLEGCA